jgi:uncharacterized protein
MNKNLLLNIKTVIHSFFPDAKVLLFGSRARGDERKDSDYDLLVITKSTFPAQEKVSWRSKIDKALVKSIHAPVDVILNSEEEIESKKTLPGHVVQWALKEGVWL